MSKILDDPFGVRRQDAALESGDTSPQSKFKLYPEYKDSGVEWLGKVPIHWEMKQLKRLFNVVNGSTPKSENPDYWDGDIPWVTPDDLGALLSRELMAPQRYITEAGYQNCGTTLVPTGSLVLSTRAPIGHLAIAGVDLCTNQGCRSLVFLDKSNRNFFYYQLLAARSELESWGQGSTFKELSKTKLEYVYLINPPFEEQNTIADFLDRETAKIDALISKNEQLIELLQEKRNALISQAVTKGLDRNVPMKDSGIDWLGEIPAHWEMRRLKFISQVKMGQSPPSELCNDFGEGIPFLQGNAEFGSEYPTPRMYCSSPPKKAFKGDHLFSVRAPVGAINTADQEYGIGRGLCAITAQADKLNHRFCRYLLECIREQLISVATGSTYEAVSVDQVNNVICVLPKSLDQESIAQFLDHETAKIDSLTAKIREGIDRLKEYRTALISAAVTGKIDVRGEVA